MLPNLLANVNDPLVVLVSLIIMIGASNHYVEDHNPIIIIIVHIVIHHNFTNAHKTWIVTEHNRHYVKHLAELGFDSGDLLWTGYNLVKPLRFHSRNPTGLFFDVDVLSKTIWLSSWYMLHLSAGNCSIVVRLMTD